MENLLHYAWKYRLYHPDTLRTTDQLSVEVLDPGVHNFDSGPDFFNAKLRIGDVLWVGNIEIHVRASDWNRHKHHEDAAYNSVIAHIVSEDDCRISTQDGRMLPQFVVPYPHSLEERYIALLKSDSLIACREIVPGIDPFMLNAWKTRLLIERMEQKTKLIDQIALRTGNDWDSIFYVLLGRAFGFGINSDPFERLVRSLSFQIIQKHHTSLFQLEALLLGQAGFLSDNSVSEPRFFRLKKEYEYLAHKYRLEALDKSIWKMAKTHSFNFPVIRIVEFAALFHKYERMFAAMTDRIKSLQELTLLFQADADSYWNNRFSFEIPSPEVKKHLGKDSVHILIINAVIPVLFAYGKYLGDQSLTDRAFEILEEIKAENNVIVRNWKNLGFRIDNAYDSQAVIQLQKEYCNKRKCLFCQIGYRIMSGKY
ncbi:MAG: DUF2851 family protein [Bacteroidales bacterium]